MPQIKTRIDVVLLHQGQEQRSGRFYLLASLPLPAPNDTIETYALQEADTFGENWPKRVRVIHRLFDFFDKVYPKEDNLTFGNLFEAVHVRLYVEAVDE
jgi:hypothetical protein